MQTKSLYRWSLALALSGALLASPAAAQGKGKEEGKSRIRPELIRREKLRATGRADDRDRGRADRSRDGRREGVPPGWCLGRGNPHNTPENCGYGAARRDDRRYDDRRYDDRRYDDRGGRGYASYERAHEDFHRAHDRQCRMRAAERPLDVGWQLRVWQECRERHEDWHYRMGRDHD